MAKRDFLTQGCPNCERQLIERDGKEVCMKCGKEIPEEERREIMKKVLIIKLEKKSWDKVLTIPVPIVDVSKGQSIKRPDWHRKIYGGG